MSYASYDVDMYYKIVDFTNESKASIYPYTFFDYVSFILKYKEIIIIEW